MNIFHMKQSFIIHIGFSFTFNRLIVSENSGLSTIPYDQSIALKNVLQRIIFTAKISITYHNLYILFCHNKWSEGGNSFDSNHRVNVHALALNLKVPRNNHNQCHKKWTNHHIKSPNFAK